MSRLKTLARREAGLPPLAGGHSLCQGCGIPAVVRTVLGSFDRPVVVVNATGCLEVATTRFPTTAWNVPWVHVAFENAAAVASGVDAAKRALRRRNALPEDQEPAVVVFAGDGGTYDIGMATVSAVAERDEDVLYVCYDNEIYGNTGGQRSSATPVGASTSTTPTGKHHAKKDILSIMASHRIPYAASVSLAHVDDMMRKFRRALDTRGFRFLHILSPCPTGWKSEPAEGIQLIRQAVDSGLYPVIEIADGTHYTINIEPSFSVDALRAFIEGQGRFLKSKIAVETVQAGVQQQWEMLRRQARP